MRSDGREELESLIADVEREMTVERWKVAFHRLKSLTETDNPNRTRVYLVGARCHFIARNQAGMEELLTQARETASAGPVESRVRVALVEASIATAGSDVKRSTEKLEFIFAHFDETPTNLRALAHAIQGRNNAYEGSYSEAIGHSQEALKISPNDLSSASFARGTLAYVFQSMGRVDESEEFGLEQIQVLTAQGSKNGLAGLYALLGEGAASRQDWPKAVEYQSRAAALLGDTPKSSVMRSPLLAWMANSELELGNISKAIEYLQEALALAKENANAILLCNVQVLYGDALLKNGEPEEAFAILQIPLSIQDQLYDGQKINLFRVLAETYKALDRRAEAFDICWRLWELQTDFDGRTREALLKYHRSLEQKIHAQKTAILNLKATQMERELALTATQLASQVDLLGRFRNELREILRETEEPSSALKQVKEKLKLLPCQQIDWASFETQFTSVHPEFKTLLEEKHPDLTRSEVKICSLSRLKLTSEEIAQLICLSARSVETHRFNIRKKLGLKKEQNLVTYLASL
jgi:tetratricopeptide (TPR) repeat protein/DNA-binding CsgD family transcriptional regulator